MTSGFSHPSVHPRPGSEGPRSAGRRSRLLAGAAAALLAVACGAGPAQAEPAYFPITNDSTTRSNDGGMVAGTRFTALTAQTFNSLGFIDVNATATNHNEFLFSDGLLGSYTVGLWLVSTQQLLASTVVTPESPLMNSYRYAPIPTITIPAGEEFIIGALLPESPQDSWLADINVINRSGIMGFGAPRYNTGGTLDFPDQIPTGFITGWGVANASDAVVVPEPGTTVCLGIGLGGLAMFPRRRPAKANA